MGELAKIWGAALIGALVGGVSVGLFRSQEPTPVAGSGDDLREAIASLEDSIRGLSTGSSSPSPAVPTGSHETATSLEPVIERLDRGLEILVSLSAAELAVATATDVDPHERIAPVSLDTSAVLRIKELKPQARQMELFGLTARELYLELGAPSKAFCHTLFMEWHYYVIDDAGESRTLVAHIRDGLVFHAH